MGCISETLFFTCTPVENFTIFRRFKLNIISRYTQTQVSQLPFHVVVADSIFLRSLHTCIIWENRWGLFGISNLASHVTGIICNFDAKLFSMRHVKHVPPHRNFGYYCESICFEIMWEKAGEGVCMCSMFENDLVGVL